MKTMILCGGLGTRLREETEFRPKPMVEVGGRPILWHVMKGYAAHGFTDFVLCLGYRGTMIKDYFLNYEAHNSDVTVCLSKSKGVKIHNSHAEDDWQVTLVETGQTAMTGARVKRASRYIPRETFLLTYGDGVSDVDLGELVRFHKAHGKLATVTGVYPPSRFGELIIEGTKVTRFSEKPQISDGLISGGFFVLEPGIFDYLSEDDDCVLETQAIERLARDGQLQVFQHKGFWQCMDTYRDQQFLAKLWDSGAAPWKVWDRKPAARKAGASRGMK